MKNNPLDDIITCNVEISAPASSDTSFDSILLVVPAPAKGTSKMTKVTAISKADELLDYGFATTDTAYAAATVAFSQSPAPSELYICVRTKSGDTYDGIADVLTQAATEANFYGIHLTSFTDAEDVAAAVSYADAMFIA